MTATLVYRNGVLFELPPGYPQESVPVQPVRAPAAVTQSETNYLIGGLIGGFILGAFVWTQLGRELAGKAKRRGEREIRKRAGLK